MGTIPPAVTHRTRKGWAASCPPLEVPSGAALPACCSLPSCGGAGWESTLSVTCCNAHWTPTATTEGYSSITYLYQDAQPFWSLWPLACHKIPRGQAGEHSSSFLAQQHPGRRQRVSWTHGHLDLLRPGPLCLFSSSASPRNSVPSKSQKSGLFWALSLEPPSRGLWVQAGRGASAPSVGQASPCLAQAQPPW